MSQCAALCVEGSHTAQILFAKLLEGSPERPERGNRWAAVLTEPKSHVLWCTGFAPRLHLAFAVMGFVLAQGPSCDASPIPLSC